MAKAGKKRITSLDKRRARAPDVLAANPDLIEHFRRQDEARETVNKIDFFSWRRPAQTAVDRAAAKTPTITWIIGEARRLKAAGKISENIRITHFANLLAERMCEAAQTNKALRPVTSGYIKNELPDWGLWPVSLIKI